ncbi:MAG: signal peptidase II [Clostridia bacterium]|nr:signal peptidase II [Clostridia bacterium]
MKNKKLTPFKIKALSLISIVLLVGADQLIKYFIDLFLKPVGSITVIPKVLQLSYYENDGAMMGMMSGKTTVMTVFAVLCLLLVCYILYSGKLGYGIDFWCVVFVAAGGIGNLIDRVFRGYVIDYIEVLFVDFYIFNFADCLVTCAAVAIIISQIYQFTKESKKNKRKEKNTDD